MPPRRRRGRPSRALVRARMALKRSRRNLSNVKGGTPIPTTFKTKMRYSEAVTLNPGAGGACSVYTAAANGLWDVSISGVGHQPRGWDEIIPLYNHAIVIGSKIKVEFLNRDGAAAQLVGIALRSGSATEVDPNNYLEGGHVTYKTLNSTGGADKATMDMTFSNSFLGISDPLSTAIVRNSDSANPTELGVYHVFAANPWGTDSGAVQVLVTVEYVVVFTEPKVPIQS